MKSITTFAPHAIAITALLAALPFSAGAQTLNANVSTSVGTSVSTAGVHANASASTDTTKANADQDITKRVDSLNSIITRFGEMKKLSGTELTALTTSANAQIADLNTLKVKIDADTDATALKTDIQSITKDIRVYLLVLPQSRILAASDRIQTIIGDMNTLDAKLTVRISAAQASGKDVSAATTAKADLAAKIADANTQATAAVSATANLTPDNGNATLAASNKAAIKAAAAKIKAATTDLKAARADIGVIVKATVSK